MSHSHEYTNMKFSAECSNESSSVYSTSHSSKSRHDKSSVSSLSTNDQIQITPRLDEDQLDDDINAGYFVHDKALGESQFGKVRLVTHLKTFQLATLKVVNKRRFRNEEDRQMVKNEINSLKVLKHDNIARLLHLIETKDCYYIIREHCSNGDLYSYVDQKGKLTESESRNIFRDIIDCLDYMHERGFSHRDIRPENVLIDSAFRIKLISFRFAHLCFTDSALPVNDLASIRTQYLSPEYTAPELLSGTVVSSPAIDVWSAGVLLYFMLTGTLPFTDDNLARLFRKIQSGIFELQSELLDDARHLIVSMLQVHPLERTNVKQILSHQWLRQCAMPNKEQELGLAHSEDRLHDKALSECYQLHSHEVQDIVQLRYNIRYKFGYQTATYWLIKEHFDHFKSLYLKPNCRSSKVTSDRFAQNVDSEACGKRPIASSITSGHTFMESRVAPNSTKVDIKSAGSTVCDGKCAITTSLTEQESSQPSESKERNKLGREATRKDASIVDLAEHGKHAEPVSDDQMWPAKSKSHFNLRRIFSKSRIADERSNSAKSIEEDSECDGGQTACRQVLSHKSTSSLKKSLSRKLSLALSTKLLGRNLSRINSASTVNKQDFDVTAKRVCPPPRDQWESSLAETTDSDEQRVNRAKTIRFSAIDCGFDQADGHSDNGFEMSHLDTTTIASASSCSDNVQVSIKRTHTIDQLDGATGGKQLACKINRHQPPTAAKSSKSGSSVAIITRYSNYEECLEEAMAVLTKKGINSKADKHKLRCCLSTMNEVIVAFELHFLTFPSLNGGSFVTIKAKKLRGHCEDFHVISAALTRHFEQRLLKRPHSAARK